MKLTLISPTKKIINNLEIISVRIPTSIGEIQILENHLPVLGVVAPGLLRLTETDREETYAVGAGIYEITAHEVRVIADMVSTSDEARIADIATRKAEAHAAMCKAQKDGLVGSDSYLAAENEYLKQTALEQLAHRQ